MLQRVSRQSRTRSTKQKVFPAPVRGLIKSGNITTAQPDAAEALDNFFPTAQGCKLRKGSALHATLDATPIAFITYQTGAATAFYAASDTFLYDVKSPADAAVTPTPTLRGLTSGDWSSVQFSTSGGDFAVAVNGADNGIYFDGSNVQPLVDETVFDLAYDALTGEFTPGQTVTGGTSGATAEILAVAPSSATAGTLKLGAITGTFQDNEALTDPLTGAATSNIPSGTSTASTVTITGVTTAALAQVWMFKERLFFVEKNTLSTWYLPVDSIGGAASEINLGSVFRKGGSLVIGATWSLDSGDGLDDKCLFVTDQGEVAVFEGTDPASASTWALVGVYEIGKPLGKNAIVRLGGDVIILTEDGAIPISEAVVKDRGALTRAAITFPIEDEYRAAITERSTAYPISATLWQAQGILLIGTPVLSNSKNVALVANARTGAWCRYTGWDVRCAGVFADNLYFGSDGGKIYQGETGGSDDDVAYTGIYVPKFSECGTPNTKIVNHANLIARAYAAFDFNMAAFSDYSVGTLTAPSPINDPGTAGVWGTGVWGTFTWGDGGNTVSQSRWKTVAAQGFSVAPAVAITSNQDAPPEIEITATQIRYEEALPL